MENNDFVNSIFNYFKLFFKKNEHGHDEIDGILLNQNINWSEFKEWGDKNVGEDGWLRITTSRKREPEQGKPDGYTKKNTYTPKDKQQDWVSDDLRQAFGNPEPNPNNSIDLNDVPF